MEFALAIEMDASIERLHSALADIATKLKQFFHSREYGKDLLHIFVGVILTHPDSSKLHPVRKPNYKKLLKYKSSLTNETVEMTNVLQYDVKPDYEVFYKLNSEGARRLLCEILVESTEVIDARSASFPDFDVQRFKADLQSCLISSIYKV
jgi:hypothetical protein